MLLLAGLAGGRGLPQLLPALLLAAGGAWLLLLSRRRRSALLAVAGVPTLAASPALLVSPGNPLAVSVSPAILVPVAAAALFLLVPAGGSLRFRKDVRAGGMPLPGIRGTAATALPAGEAGKVLVAGELFLATSDGPADAGAGVCVIGVRGGVLRVAPLRENGGRTMDGALRETSVGDA